jgi:transcriptional regulator with XRE-family HTH domain
MSFSKKIFSQRLRELRHSQQLTIEQLAKGLGLVKQTVGNWETGARVPSLELMVSLADFFDVSLDYLVGRSDDLRRR